MSQDHKKGAGTAVSAAEKAQKKALREARKAGLSKEQTKERKGKPPEKSDPEARRAAKRAERQLANQAERAARKAERQKGREQRKGQKTEKADNTQAAADKHNPIPTRPVKILPIARPNSEKALEFNILIIAQAGRLSREAAIFAASLRRFSPGWKGRLIVAEPLSDGAWSGVKTAIPQAARDVLTGFGAEITPFTAQEFGHSYPYGNKIEALSALPKNEPFVFFDSDTLVTGPLDGIGFDFSRPSASMRREGSWPVPPLYGPGYTAIWRSLYDRFGLDFESSLDTDHLDEHWERYLYFNAGWFLGADPQEFGRRFLKYALDVRNHQDEVLASQTLDPWLDQIVLPLVIHSLGGGRPGAELAALDGSATCHYRNLSLLYARESDETIAAFETIAALPEIEKLMRGNEAYEKLFRQGAGMEGVRPLFAGKAMPSKEQAIRHAIRKAELWFRG